MPDMCGVQSAVTSGEDSKLLGPITPRLISQCGSMVEEVTQRACLLHLQFDQPPSEALETSAMLR